MSDTPPTSPDAPSSSSRSSSCLFRSVKKKRKLAREIEDAHSGKKWSEEGLATLKIMLPKLFEWVRSVFSFVNVPSSIWYCVCCGPYEMCGLI